MSAREAGGQLDDNTASEMHKTVRGRPRLSENRVCGTMQAHRVALDRPGLSSCRPGRMAAMPGRAAQQARPNSRGGRRHMRVVADYRLGGEESARVRGS